MSESGGDPEPVIDGVGRCRIWGEPQEIRLVVGGAESAPGRPLDLGCAYVGPLPGDTREVEVRLPREATMAGVVRGADSQGVRGVQVRANLAGHEREAVEPVSQAYTGAEGAFLLRGLCEGDFEISVLASGEFLPVAPRRVPAGTSDLVIELRRAVNPVLTFVGEEGRPIAGVHVVVTENGNRGKTIDGTRTDERGRARLRHLDPEARYQLRPTAPSARSDLRLLPNTDWEPTDGTFRFETVRHITGKVVDEAGEPVEGAMVRIVMGDHTKGTVGPTGADGTFDIGSLPAGEADLRALPPGAHIKEWESPFIPVATGSRDVVLVTSRGAAIRGWVPGWTGGDRRVMLARLGREDADPFLRGAAIAADGTFRFTGLPEGAEYALWLPPEQAGNSAFATGIKSGGPEAVLDLTLGRTITGRLRVPEGWIQPSVGAHRPDLGIHVPAVLAEDGTFVISGLPDLEFDVHASVARTGKFLQGTVRARAGESIDIDIKE